MDVRHLLHGCYLFKELDGTELNALTAIVEAKRIKRGGILFLQGDEATGFFVLLLGRVRIYKVSPEGKEYTLHLINPGGMFAEAAIFKGTTFPANCAAVEDSIVAFLPKKAFIQLLDRSPAISLKMIGALSAFVREFNQQLADLSLREVPARLASYLLRKSEESGGNTVTLEITKSELASTLGTISETLSRNLKKLRDLGVVEVDGKDITILEPVRLQSIADGEKI
jgi:CRP/FNR family transcriptional regulator